MAALGFNKETTINHEEACRVQRKRPLPFAEGTCGSNVR